MSSILTWDGAAWLPHWPNDDDAATSIAIEQAGSLITTTSLARSTSSVTSGQSMTLTPSVKSALGATINTGTVQVQKRGAGTTAWGNLGSPVAPGTGVSSGALTTSMEFRAVYTPSAGLQGSTSPTTSVAVTTSIVTTLALARSVGTINNGQSMTLTATVSPAGAAGGTIGIQRYVGSGVWTTIGTSTNVSYALSVAPTSDTTYRAYYTGTGVYEDSLSVNAVVTVRQLVTQTPVTKAADADQSYGGDGGKKPADGHLYRGYISGTWDNQRAWIRFPALGISGAANVTKVRLYLYAQHWYGNSGGALSLSVHGDAAVPASGSSVPPEHNRFNWDSKTGGRWITLNTSDLWASGGLRGVWLRPGDSTSNAYYAYFADAASTAPPKIEVTYQVWE